MSKMTLKTAAACLVANIKADIPTMLWGPPGVGKSDVMRQVAKSLGYGLIDFRATLRDPVDLRGLPHVDAKAGTARWLAPNELPQVARDGEKGILFLDELPNAAPSMQAACFGLVLDRMVGEYKLPPGWIPLAAGNRLADRGASQRMPTPLRNRFAHFEVEADVAAWVEWATRAGVHPLVVAFVRFRPSLIHQMPQGEENAFPTPRAWENVAKIVDEPDAVRVHLISALVGDAVATELEGFLRIWKSLPSIDAIMRDPKSVRVPNANEPAVLYALTSALARNSTKDNFANALEYSRRLPKEFEVMMAIDAVRRDDKLQKTKAFGEWASRNSAVVL